MSRAILCLYALFVAGAFCQEDEKSVKDASVWVIDDTDKVHPITGNLLSEGGEVYDGRTQSQDHHRRSNAIWDAESRTVKLLGGRNEFVSFQLVIEKGHDDLHKVFVNATDLLGSRERISADSNVRLFKELYMRLDGTWYPDALLPFEIAGATPFELPDGSSPVRGQRVQPVWVDIYIPRGLPPDTYTGQLTVLHRNTNKQAAVTIELEVGDYTLPDKLSLDVDLMNYGFVNIERGWPNLTQDGPRHRAIEREFFRMAHAHRMTFAIVPYNHDGSIPKGQKPTLAGVEGAIRVADWSSWDDRYGPVLSGDAFADLPRSRQPVAHFFLPYNLMWPSDMRNWERSAYRTEHLRVSEDFRKHLAEKGWTRTLYEIYYNHKELYGFFPWNLDEPTRDKDLGALRYLGTILQESFPKGDPVRVAFRLDIGHFHCENVPECRYPPAREASRKAYDALQPFVTLWNIGAPHYFANLPLIKTLKAAGKIVYFYGSTPRVNEPLAEAVRWGWNGYRYEADGICFWNATDWGDWDTDAAPGDPYINAGGRYAGASMIFYPGAKFGHDGPIASLRLKALRRGLQDYECLRLLERGGGNPGLAALLERFQAAKTADYPALRATMYKLLTNR